MPRRSSTASPFALLWAGVWHTPASSASAERPAWLLPRRRFRAKVAVWLPLRPWTSARAFRRRGGQDAGRLFGFGGAALRPARGWFRSGRFRRGWLWRRQELLPARPLARKACSLPAHWPSDRRALGCLRGPSRGHHLGNRQAFAWLLRRGSRFRSGRLYRRSLGSNHFGHRRLGDFGGTLGNRGRRDCSGCRLGCCRWFGRFAGAATRSAGPRRLLRGRQHFCDRQTFLFIRHSDSIRLDPF